MPSDYRLLVYEIFVANLLKSILWLLPNNHELIQSYDASFNNVTKKRKAFFLQIM